MPILFGLYAALVAIGPYLANSRFFWIPDLAFPSYTQGMAWLTEDFQAGNWGRLTAYLILPVLLMVSQFVMQKWMTPAMPQGDDNPTAGMTKQMTYLMTFMFGFFTLQVPAGLTLYWVTSNLLQMLQQWAVTSDRFGLSKPSPKLATALANSGNANGAPAKQVTTAPALPEPNQTDGSPAEAAPAVQASEAKDPRRRRAKRR
jgi:YidC/Oxa1 family membrane protein insertase